MNTEIILHAVPITVKHVALTRARKWKDDTDIRRPFIHDNTMNEVADRVSTELMSIFVSAFKMPRINAGMIGFRV